MNQNESLMEEKLDSLFYDTELCKIFCLKISR